MDKLTNMKSKFQTILYEKKVIHYLVKLLLISSTVIVSTLIYQQRTFITEKFERKQYRIAHCMTGVPRTLYKEEVYVAYRRQALNILPGDLFLILQMTNRTEDVHGTIIRTNQPERYEAAIKYLSPRRIEWIPAGNHLGAIEDISGNAKWKRCLDHIEQVEKENQFQYDFIVRTRPDLFIAKDLPTADILPHDRILINPYYECIQIDILQGYTQIWSDIPLPCNKKNYGLSDLFAILPRKLAQPYLNVAFTPNLPRHVCGQGYMHVECPIRAVLYKANITFELWPFVIKIMRSNQFCHLNAWNRFNSWC
ncbi:unnamed protein product [Adineta ricciae]|uniref:Uncharacterized protein n=1 Tax=Adineta ricciae TaxID=249248 RepID=A0A814XLB5_ADIRI|nr:unnamed protein product [Adineta ricciae]CAF1215678.1 unnamed protein product [Adineta ricciae]